MFISIFINWFFYYRVRLVFFLFYWFNMHKHTNTHIHACTHGQQLLQELGAMLVRMLCRVGAVRAGLVALRSLMPQGSCSAQVPSGAGSQTPMEPNPAQLPQQFGPCHHQEGSKSHGAQCSPSGRQHQTPHCYQPCLSNPASWHSLTDTAPSCIYQSACMCMQSQVHCTSCPRFP